VSCWPPSESTRTGKIQRRTYCNHSLARDRAVLPCTCKINLSYITTELSKYIITVMCKLQHTEDCFRIELSYKQVAKMAKS